MSRWWLPANWPILKEPYPNQYQNKPFTKPIDDIPLGSVILCSSDKFNLISWLIRKITYARVSHALTYWGTDHHETIEAEARGVTKDTLNTRINTHDMLWVWRYKRLTVDQLMLMRGYAYGSVGKMYDYPAIAEFVLGGGHPTNSMAICSGEVVRIFSMASIKLSDKNPDQTSPGDLDRYFRSHPDEWELWDIQNVKLL